MSEFSSARAFQIHSENLKNIFPHPVGTPANNLVRKRITQHLKLLGYEVEHQSGFNCDQFYGGCSQVINIIAVKPGKAKNKAVLITGHYESVPASFGASDDGMGVATNMEVARIVMACNQNKENMSSNTYIPVHGSMDQTASFEISLPEGKALELLVIDYDLLREVQDAGSVLKFRPDDVKPIHGGDRSIIFKSFKF